MRACTWWLSGLLALLACATAASAQGPAGAKDARALARRIDELIARRWAEAKIAPTAPADDAEFLRRVWLDLAGTIPPAAEARAFLAETRSDRRERLVERLLASPRHVRHQANVCRALFIPEAGNNFLVRVQQGNFEAWLRRQVARDVGYDALVRELLTAPLGGGQGIAALLQSGAAGPSPLAFYSAKEFKAENLAADTARVFLGASVECAQCHNHPFADWKREQFWSFAAFFSGVKSQRVMDFLLPGGEDPQRRELKVPGTDKIVRAKYLDGADPKWKPGTASRATLAAWVTAPENPYFARAAVNRLWANYLGTGLVEPVDEVVGAKPSHPEVLDLLAKEFAAHQFDVKFLIRTLTATRAYQLSSAVGPKGSDEPALFARMPLRGLTPEQLFDSLAMATGYRDSGGAATICSVP